MSIFARLNKDSTVQLWDKEKKKILEKTAEKLVNVYTNNIVLYMSFLFMGVVLKAMRVCCMVV